MRKRAERASAKQVEPRSQLRMEVEGARRLNSHSRHHSPSHISAHRREPTSTDVPSSGARTTCSAWGPFASTIFVLLRGDGWRDGPVTKGRGLKSELPPGILLPLPPHTPDLTTTVAGNHCMVMPKATVTMRACMR